MKSLYDAFHEPFRKVLPVNSAAAQPIASQNQTDSAVHHPNAQDDVPTEMPMDEVQGSDDSEAE